jgi:16S rRNA (cytidine1402-2'-O)-methyltransferase
MPGTLYLIPVPVAENALHTLPAEIFTITLKLKHFFAENVRTARRFLKVLHPALEIDPLQLSEIDKHHGPDLKLLKQWLMDGHAVGVMSEAGCPGIADPGSELVVAAQQCGAVIRPLTGPNSMMLALMASGLNGQRFAFYGYLPVKDPARSARIKALELHSKKEDQTQLFIETPYRNNQLLADLIKNCAASTQICVAQNLTARDELIRTKTVAEWKKDVLQLEKSPAVFLMLSS